MYNSVAASTFTVLCPAPELIHPPEQQLCTHLIVLPHPPPQPLLTTCLLSACMNLVLFWVPCVTRNIQYLSFCIWFVWLTMFWRFIPCCSMCQNFLPFYCWITFHCMDVGVCARALSRFSPDQLFATLWTVAHQALLSMGFFRQKYWNGLPCSLPGHLNDPRIKPASLMSSALAGGFFITFYSCTLLSVDTWVAPVF